MGGLSVNTLAWIYLAIAGIFETAWMISLKETHGFKVLGPTVIFLFSAAASMFFLSQALKHLSIGTSYAVWTGIGMIGTVVVGIVWYKDPATFSRMVCLTLIAAGVLGLKLYEKG